MSDCIDYFCKPKYDDHHYFSARFNSKDKQTHLKVRIHHHNQSKIYFKINFLEEYTEIWEDKSSRLRIDQVISYDFKDLLNLRNKLRTYLVFS